MAKQVVVIGGGIGGLTTAALLARRGYRVQLFEQAAQLGAVPPHFSGGALPSMLAPPKWLALKRGDSRGNFC